MADVLNLVPKKDVFDAIMNGASNELTIDNTPYWKKRLMESNFMDFKDYKTLRISCGTPEKFDFEIDDMQLVDNKFVISINRNEDKSSQLEESGEKIKDMTTLKEVEKKISMVSEQMGHDEIKKKSSGESSSDKSNGISSKTDNKPIGLKEPARENLKDRVKKIVSEFIKKDNVFSVPNTETVVIHPNGQINGTNKKILADKDLETIIEFNRDVITRYGNVTDDDFIDLLKRKLDRYSLNSYVFIALGGCNWFKYASGEDSLLLKIVSRKTYMFGRR